MLVVMKSKQIISKEDLKRKSLTGFLSFPNRPLMGVYNTKTGEIFLWPCINEKVGLIRASSGELLKYDSGYRLDKNLQMIMGKGKLTADEIKEINQSHFIPRVIADSMDDLENDMSKKRLTGHEYILELCGELESLRDYKGFTIIQKDGKVEYIWDSGALNSPYDENGIRQRQRGAKVPKEYQVKIEAVIDKWGNTIPERFISVVNFIVNLSTKENKDVWSGKAASTRSFFSLFSKEVPAEIVEIRNIIKDKSLNDTERMNKIVNLARDKKESFFPVKKDEKTIELIRLLAGGSDNLHILLRYYDQLKSDLSLALPQNKSPTAK